MKKFISFAIALCCALAVFSKEEKEKPATVIITAGQSNTDGRVPNTQLPDYICQNPYRHCWWCYGSAGKVQTDGFELFRPRMAHPERPERWAYDAVTYYWLEQALQQDFYVIKWSLGGTAIDTECSSTSQKYWSANPDWLAANQSTWTGGKSLLRSFTELIDSCIDNKLSKLPQGYEIKAFLWHQGESDRHRGKRYYENLKAVVTYVREHLVKKTGEKKYYKLPFVCGTVSRKNKQYNADVEAALYKLAKEDKNFYVIDMADAELQSDQLHFTAQSAEHLGKQMYNRLVKLGVAGKRAREVE